MSRCEHCGEEHERVRFCPLTGNPIPTEVMRPGTMLEGKYRIDRFLGEGGMGAVFQATHTLLEKRVAIKVMLPGDAAERLKLPERLQREARAASATGHRNITAVTDMGHTEDGSLFVVMEYLEGISLKDLVEQEGVVDVSRAVRWIQQVLSGLEVVHRKGIIHRDLKPENLMLVQDDSGEEVVKILDFGISKIVAGDAKLDLTATGLLMGTPRFMSPEQAASEPNIDFRTDLYSTGAILYLLVTGTPPHQQDRLNELIIATLNAPIDPPSRRNPDIPRELDRVLLKALARAPRDRYPDARSFREALKPFGDLASLVNQVRPGPQETGIPALPPDLKPSSLVHLDEIERPALQQASSTQRHPLTQVTGVEDDEAAPRAEIDDKRFRAPSDHARPLELDTKESKAKEKKEKEKRGSDPPAQVRSPYGQARKQTGSRASLWIALGVAVVGAGGWYLFRDYRERQARARATPAVQQSKIYINVQPAWAEILVDGVTLSSNPLILTRSSREYSIQAGARGYFTQTVTMKPVDDMNLLIELKPIPGQGEPRDRRDSATDKARKSRLNNGPHE